LSPCAHPLSFPNCVKSLFTAFASSHFNKASAIIMSFPSIVDGKPLFSHRDEKLEFRFILNQRVFETTFIVNSTDLFDGTETVMHTPTRVDEPTPAVLP